MKCRKSKSGYHHFETRTARDGTLLDFDDAVYEICNLCGRKEKWNKYRGKIDNADYAEAHAADFAQPYGRTSKIFNQEYGTIPDITKKGTNAE